MKKKQEVENPLLTVLAVTTCGRKRHKVSLNKKTGAIITDCPKDVVQASLAAKAFGGEITGCCAFVHAIRSHDKVVEVKKSISLTAAGKEWEAQRGKLQETRRDAKTPKLIREPAKSLRKVASESLGAAADPHPKVTGHFFDYNYSEGKGFPKELRLLVFMASVVKYRLGWFEDTTKNSATEATNHGQLLVSLFTPVLKSPMHDDHIVITEMRDSFFDWYDARDKSKPPVRSFWWRFTNIDEARTLHRAGFRLALVTPKVHTPGAEVYIVDLNNPKMVPLQLNPSMPAPKK